MWLELFCESVGRSWSLTCRPTVYEAAAGRAVRFSTYLAVDFSRSFYYHIIRYWALVENIIEVDDIVMHFPATLANLANIKILLGVRARRDSIETDSVGTIIVLCRWQRGFHCHSATRFQCCPNIWPMNCSIQMAHVASMPMLAALPNWRVRLSSVICEK